MDTSLKTVNCVKDLGIMVSSDLSWCKYVGKGKESDPTDASAHASAHFSQQLADSRRIVGQLLANALPTGYPYKVQDALVVSSLAGAV